MRPLSLLCIAGVLTAAAISPLYADSLQVGPILVQMVEGERAATVSIRNNSPEAVSMQVRTMDWTQSTGEDALAPSQVLAASPPAFTVQPGEAQTVRVVVAGAADSASEHAWRLVVDELPHAPASAGASITTPLRLYVPVFLTPSAGSRSQLHWSAHRTPAGLVVTAQNSGASFERIATATFSADGGGQVGQEISGYVLAGATRSWTLAEAPASVQTLTAAGTGISGEISASIPIE